MIDVDTRIVEIYCTTDSGDPSRGSGLLVAPGVVLTAAHVVADTGDAARVKVRRASTDDPQDWLPVEKLVLPVDDTLRVAVVKLAQATTDEPPPIADIDVDEPLPFRAIGFPRAQRDGERRDLEDARGSTAPYSATRDQLLSLDVASATPADAGDGGSGWSGLSGSAVWAYGLLAGVVVTDNRKFRAGGRLEAVAVTRLLGDARLGPHLPGAWQRDRRQRVSSLLTFAVGAARTIRISPPRRWFTDDVRRILRDSPTAPLHAKYQLVDFTGRSNELTQLADWCEAPQRVSYAVLSGPGGSGKSRLAAELCRHVERSGWVAGIATTAGGSASAGIDSLRRPVLLVVDYVDSDPGGAADLIAGFLARVPQQPVRLLMLARSASAFLPRLHRAMGLERHDPALDLRLQQQELSRAERYQHYLAAWHAFHRVKSARPIGEGAAPADIGATTAVPAGSDVSSEPPTLDELGARLDILTTPLLLHAQALLDLPAAVPGDGDGNGGGDGDGETAAPTSTHAGDIDALLDALLDREDKYFWESVLGSRGLDSDTQRMDVFAIATFAGADTTAQAALLLSLVPGLGGDRARADTLVQVLREIYGEDPLPSVRPDLLGERLIARRLLVTGDAPRIFGAAVEASQRSRMLEILLRMSHSPSPATAHTATDVLTGILAERLPELAEQANEQPAVATSITSDSYLLATRIATALEQVEVPQAAAAAAQVQFHSQARLHRLSAAVSRQAATHHQQVGDVRQAVQSLQDASKAYLRLGQPDAAASLSDEAIGFLRRSPQVGGDNQWGRLLSTTSLVRIGSGDVRDAIDAGRRAVDLAETAAADDPDGNLVPLAEARRHLALAHLGAGEHTAAVEALRKAVDRAGRLPAVEEGRLRLAYATTLLTVADGDNALIQAARAVDRFAAATPTPYVELSGAQVFLANLRALAGEWETARDEAVAAVGVADRAADPGSDEARFNQASVRLSAGSVLLQVGDEAALEYLREARRRFQLLREELRDQFEFAYALSCIAYAEALYQLDHDDEALTEANIADDLVEDIYARHPRRMFALPVLSAKLRAAVYAASGELTQAIEIVERAIDRLAQLDPIGSRPTLAELYTLSGLLQLEDDRYESALRAAEDAVKVYQQVSEGEPQTYLVGLLTAHLLQLAAAAQLSDAGFDAEADRSVRDLTEQFRKKAHKDENRQMLALVLYVQAQVRHEQGNLPQAIELVREALDQYQVIDPRFPGFSDDQALLAADLAGWTAERDGTATPSIIAGELVVTEHQLDNLDALAVPAELEQRQHRVVLGRRGDQLIAATSFRPVLVLGPQRSRKTTSMVIPTLLEWHGPAVVTSIRTDVLSGSVRRRAAAGQVTVFDPAERLVEGRLVRAWNPIDGCRTWEGAVLTAHALVEAGRMTGRSGVRDEQFWYNMAKQLLEALLYAAGATGRTMADVHSWVKTMEHAEVQARLMVADDAHHALQAFRGIRALSEMTMTSVYATASTLLTAYGSAAVRRNSVTDFDVDAFFDGQPNTLYLCAPPEDQQVLAPIFTALIQRVVAEAYRRHNSGASPLPLLLLLDEAGNIAQLDNLHTLATSAAGTGIQLVTVFHDLSQMEALYGEQRASTIANNHSALLLLPGNRDQRSQQLYRSIVADDPVLGMRQRSLRQLAPGTALCVYEHLPADIVTLRSSSHDSQMRKLAGPSVVGDEAFAGLLTFRAGQLADPAQDPYR